MSKTYKYRFTGKGAVPVFRTPMTKVGESEYESSCPIQHPDFEEVGASKPTETEEKKNTGTKAGKKSNKNDGEE